MTRNSRAFQGLSSALHFSRAEESEKAFLRFDGDRVRVEVGPPRSNDLGQGVAFIELYSAAVEHNLLFSARRS
jgi:hypothetical protein